MKNVRTVCPQRLLLPLMLVWALPLSCGDSEPASRCPFGRCSAPAPAAATAASPSASLVANIQSADERPSFVDFGLFFGNKMAADSIAVVEDLAGCDAAEVVSGVVLDRRDAEGLDVDFDTAIACWATSSSESPLAVVLVTVTLPYGPDEQLLTINAALSESVGDVHFPEVGASWAVGYSWQYSTNDAGS